jgi:glycosyltransferase involved in cell wall biosynthesis
MTVLFVTQYGQRAASSRTRVFQYLPFLRQQGLECRVVTVLPDRGLGGSQVLVTRSSWRKIAYYIWALARTCRVGLQLPRLARGAHVLFIQKVILPAPVRWWIRRRRLPVVYDFDDAIFTTEVRQRHWLAAWKERRNAAGLPTMLSLARLAIVENDYTGQYAAAQGPAVLTITGPIDTLGHRPGPRRPPGDEPVVLGWIGSATTLPYLELIAAPLQRLSARFPGLVLHVVGAAGVTLPGVKVVARPWALEREVADLQGFDIGLMPIPDDPWTRGKGGYKLLQYMAVGLPVVTSPVGVNCRIVTDGVNGYWAADAQAWEDRLARLITDPDARSAMGQAGRQVVERDYSLTVAQDRLLQALRSLVTAPPPACP